MLLAIYLLHLFFYDKGVIGLMSCFIIRRVGEIKYNFKVVFFQFALGWSKAAGIGFGRGIGNKSLQKKHMLLKWTSAASVL